MKGLSLALLMLTYCIEGLASPYRLRGTAKLNQENKEHHQMTQAELDADEASQLTPMLEKVKESVRTLDNESVEAVVPGRSDNPDNVRLVETIIDQGHWDFLFPKADDAYTYTGFLKGVAKFPAMCGSTRAICSKTLATMFAHFTQETGGHNPDWGEETPEWRQGLYFVREVGWDEKSREGYNSYCYGDVWQAETWPCGKFEDGSYKSYFGRGSKQLSYNYNYGPFSQAIYGDIRPLLDNPDWVADTWLNLASAVFFYMTPQSPKPSMQFVVDGTWQPNAADEAAGLLPGFGVTTMIINGGLECTGTVEHAQSENRIKYYKEFCNILGVKIPAKEVLGCKDMKPFGADGNGAIDTYWDQQWNENPNNPGRLSFACKIVAYQTPYQATVEGDYTRCVQHWFPNLEIIDADGNTTPKPATTTTTMKEASGTTTTLASGTSTTQPAGITTTAIETTTTTTPDAPVVSDDSGTGVSGYPHWRSDEPYNGGDRCQHKGGVWIAKWWAGANDEPGNGDPNSPWECLTPTETSTTTEVAGIITTRSVSTTKPSGGGDKGGPNFQFDVYDSSKSYPGGSVVAVNPTEESDVYSAKWWADPGTTPGTGDPWELVTNPTTPDPDATTTTTTTASLPKYTMTRDQIAADEKALTSSDEFQAVLESIRTLLNEEVEKVTPGHADNPENVKLVEKIISADDWEYLFARRDPAYTYEGFLKGVAKFPAMCSHNEEICRRTLATMFAHFAQETGEHDVHNEEVLEWRQGLYHVREMGLGEADEGKYAGECEPSTWQGQTWPCGKYPSGSYKSYFGRGSKQLSYNYNYGPFSQIMYGNVEKLLNEPELVADTWLNLASAVFFYMQPQTPKPSMQFVVTGEWVPNQYDLQAGLIPGFGVTTMIINGGVECGGSKENAQSLNRIKYYQHFANHLKVPIPDDEVLGCKGMQEFAAGGAGAINTYWDQDHNWVEGNPGGGSYKCQLVNYQTRHSGMIAGDYEKCVLFYFPNIELVHSITTEGPPVGAGSTTDSGTGVSGYPHWRSDEPYNGGDRCQHKGGVWIAKWWAGANDEPGNGDPNSPWESHR